MLASRRVCAAVVVVVVVLGCVAAPVSALDFGFGEVDFSGFAHVVASKVKNVFHSGARFVPNPAVSVKVKLQTEFRSQKIALDAIADAVEMWHTDRSMGDIHPLVLAFSGTTGVGKTATAKAVSEALLTTDDGVLELRGEDYADPAQSILMFQERLKDTLVKHVQANPSGAVVIFDEMQKARPEVLDVILPAVSRGDPHLAHRIGAHAVHIDCRNVVFIIISDIGVSTIEDLAIRAGDSDDPQRFQTALSRQLKAELDGYWEGFAIGGHIQQGIAFLPLGHAELAEIAALKLKRFGESRVGTMWGDIEISHDVAIVLTGKRYISYATYHTDDGDGGAGHSKKFALYGARDVHVSHHGSIGALKTVLFKALRPFDATKSVRVAIDNNKLVVDACGGRAGRRAAKASNGRVDPNSVCTEVYRGVPLVDKPTTPPPETSG